jgi:hypothetical protein
VFKVAYTKKTCKCTPSWKRLKGFEPSTFCMASSSSVSQINAKCLQMGRYLAAQLQDGFQEFRRKRRGLANERTMKIELGCR